MQMHVCLCVVATDDSSCLPLLLLTFSYETGSLTDTARQAGWLVGIQRTTCAHPGTLFLQKCFLVGAEDPKSAIHSGMAGTRPLEASLELNT